MTCKDVDAFHQLAVRQSSAGPGAEHIAEC